MLAGRFIFGLGGECMSVSQSAIISQWFKGKELSFAFGITLCVARLGSVATGFVVTPVANAFAANAYTKQVAYNLFLGFAICLVSWLTALLLAAIDKYADKVEGKLAIVLTEEEKFHWADLRKFERPYWLLVASCVVIYCVLFPYLSLVCNQML